jgi:hypothetical protein
MVIWSASARTVASPCAAMKAPVPPVTAAVCSGVEGTNGPWTMIVPPVSAKRRGAFERARQWAGARLHERARLAQHAGLGAVLAQQAIRDDDEVAGRRAGLAEVDEGRLDHFAGFDELGRSVVAVPVGRLGAGIGACAGRGGGGDDARALAIRSSSSRRWPVARWRGSRPRKVPRPPAPSTSPPRHSSASPASSWRRAFPPCGCTLGRGTRWDCFDAALADCERGSALAAETGRERVLLVLTIESVATLLELGRPGRGDHDGRGRHRAGAPVGAASHAAGAHSTLASARLMTGDVAGALAHATEAAETGTRADFHAAGQPGWCLGAALIARAPRALWRR